MTDYIDLIVRLRAWARDAGYPKQEIITEAADAIEQQQIEIRGWQDVTLARQTERDSLRLEVNEAAAALAELRDTNALAVAGWNQAKQRAERAEADARSERVDAERWRGLLQLLRDRAKWSAAIDAAEKKS